MDEFDASWLALREPYDHAARADTALASIAPILSDPLRVLDLGSGSGSNFRWLAPRLNGEQHWRLADKDPRLLSIAQRSHGDHPSVKDFAVERIDLAEELGRLALETVDLVTASAFIDLVSEAWLTAFVSRVADARVPALLFTLSVDGRVQWDPQDPFDETAGLLFGQHMRNDKGLGQALGYQGWERLVGLLSDAGYAVRTYDSPWRLCPRDAEIQRALLDGYASAALETDPTKADEIHSWKARRSSLMESGRSALMVGHRDVRAVFQGRSR